MVDCLSYRESRSLVNPPRPVTPLPLLTSNDTMKMAQHRLDPSEVARLLLADPARTMPAIRSLTGIVEDEQAVERMRTWLRGVVHLNAAVPAGRTMLRAPYQPAGSSRDRSIRIVSGGLPGLGKRRG